jgi:hypothetical protein
MSSHILPCYKVDDSNRFATSCSNKTNARILKAHSHSMSGSSIWASLECHCCFWIAGGLVSYLTMWPLTLQLFKNSIDTQEKLRLNLHSLSVSELLEYGRNTRLLVKSCYQLVIINLLTTGNYMQMITDDNVLASDDNVLASSTLLQDDNNECG